MADDVVVLQGAALAASKKYGTKGQVNKAVSLTILTDAQRTTYTPGNGESVYASDTHLFYIGDGSTVGGVASDVGFSTQQLMRLGILVPRHRRFLPAYRYAVSSATVANIPGAVDAGNSIVQSTGASSSATGFNQMIGVKLAAAAGFGTAGQWTPTVYGVGGSTIGTPLSFYADVAGSTAYAYPARSVVWNAAPKVCYVMSLRNEVTSSYVNAADYAMLHRITMLQIKRHNADPVFITEPPQINTGTGAILDTAANWTPLYDAARQVCSDEGVSLVDCWAYFNLLGSLGVDLRPLTSDGIHPNDAGHALIASLVVRCMMQPPPSVANPFTDRPVTDGRVAAVASYFSLTRVADAVGQTTANGTTAAATAITARGVQLAQSPTTAYVIPTSGFVQFPSTGPIRGVVVSYYTDVNSTGRPSLTFNFVGPTGAVTTGNRWDGYQTDGVTIQANIAGPFSRQFDIYYSTQGQNAGLVDDQPGYLQITANGGQVVVLGVTFVTGGAPDCHAIWPNLSSNAGNTWATTAFNGESTYSENGRASSTVGDYDILTWYGTSLGVYFETTPSSGQYIITNDGGAAGAAVDLYSVGNALTRVSVAKNLALGWHTTKIQIGPSKNASSTGNTVKYGHVYAEVCTPDPSVSYVNLASGETVNLTDYWKTAAIERIISGAPVVAMNPGASTLSLGATGAALVRLSR